MLFTIGIVATSFSGCREKETTEDKVEDIADDVEDTLDDN